MKLKLNIFYKPAFYAALEARNYEIVKLLLSNEKLNVNAQFITN